MTDNSVCQIVLWSDGHRRMAATIYRESENKHDIGSKMQPFNERRRRRGYPVIIHYLGHGLYNIP